MGENGKVTRLRPRRDISICGTDPSFFRSETVFPRRFTLRSSTNAKVASRRVQAKLHVTLRETVSSGCKDRRFLNRLTNQVLTPMWPLAEMMILVDSCVRYATFETVATLPATG